MTTAAPSDFVVLENTMLKPFATLISCRDTVSSECPRGLDLDGCIEKCRENPLCSAGYYLEPSYEKQSYCVPLNSANHQNMNLMLNYYDKDTDPTRDLWNRAVLFFRPIVYPQVQNDITIIKEKDICVMSYTVPSIKKTFYLQQDLSWTADGEKTAMQILFINVYPQFYELADTISNYETLVIKIFSKPQIMTVVDNVFQFAPYMVQNAEKQNSNLYIRIPNQTTPTDYSVLHFSLPFQIFINDRSKYMGIDKKPSSSSIKLKSIDQSIKPLGHFLVKRKNIQPNIYKVAQILPARLTFLQNMVLPFKDRDINPIVMIISIVILLMCILIVFYIGRMSP